MSRGLFRSSLGIIINADINAAYNILRNAIPKAFYLWKRNVDGIEGVWLHPRSLSLNEMITSKVIC